MHILQQLYFIAAASLILFYLIASMSLHSVRQSLYASRSSSNFLESVISTAPRVNLTIPSFWK